MGAEDSPAFLVDHGDLKIRRMRDEAGDYELMVRWRNAFHVRQWWDPDLPTLTVAAAIEEYRQDTVDGSDTTACIVELNGEPVGFMQFYRWASYADEADEVGIPFDDRSWGTDQFIGEPDHIERGLGTRMVKALCVYLEEELGASSIALTADIENIRAVRCYEKAGFERIRQVLDLDTRGGERTLDWLMIRKPKHKD
jgi:aminoglycoside 6'-N-acetyltransferase